MKKVVFIDIPISLSLQAFAEISAEGRTTPFDIQADKTKLVGLEAGESKEMN